MDEKKLNLIKKYYEKIEYLNDNNFLVGKYDDSSQRILILLKTVSNISQVMEFVLFKLSNIDDIKGRITNLLGFSLYNICYLMINNNMELKLEISENYMELDDIENLIMNIIEDIGNYNIGNYNFKEYTLNKVIFEIINLCDILEVDLDIMMDNNVKVIGVFEEMKRDIENIKNL